MSGVTSHDITVSHPERMIRTKTLLDCEEMLYLETHIHTQELQYRYCLDTTLLNRVFNCQVIKMTPHGGEASKHQTKETYRHEYGKSTYLKMCVNLDLLN